MDGEKGGSRKAVRRGGKGAAAQRAALLFPEAARKTLLQARAMTTKPSEKVKAMEDGRGAAGDFPDYVPTGEDRRMQ